MPRAVFEFSLPEDQSEFDMHRKAGAMSCLIWEFTSILRNKTKYGDPNEKVTWQEISDLWWNACREEEIDPYGD